MDRKVFPILKRVMSHFCHHIATPISSVITGTEIMEESVKNNDLIHLVRKSAQNLRDYLEIIRAIFQFESYMSEDKNDRAIFVEYAEKHSIEITWGDKLGDDHDILRLIFIMTLWCAEHGTSGKKMGISRINNNVEVKIQSKKLTNIESSTAILSGSSNSNSRSSIYSYLIKILSDDLKINIRVMNASDTEFHIIFHLTNDHLLHSGEMLRDR